MVTAIGDSVILASAQALQTVLIGNHTNMLREDDVHPLPPGAVLYAQLIKSVMGQAR
jgi:hypothetical protein